MVASIFLEVVDRLDVEQRPLAGGEVDPAVRAEDAALLGIDVAPVAADRRADVLAVEEAFRPEASADAAPAPQARSVLFRS
ncbi:MAG TPA: hypothetical protein VNT03_12075 [Baekduia sp.]|nr:hypothetical protein [Baekduia sp.]